MKLDPKYLYLSELHRISCKTLKIDYNESFSLIRRNKYIEPRFLTIYIAKHEKLIPYLSYDDIAKFFGKKEHAVVNNAIKKVSNWIETGAESYYGIKISEAVDYIVKGFGSIKKFEYILPDSTEFMEFRLKRGLSLRDIGRKSGINYETVRRIESGKDYNVNSLRLLCDYYNKLANEELNIKE